MHRLLVTTLIVLTCATACSAQAELPAGFTLAAENEHLALYIHLETTEIAVYDKAADELWFSNPQGRNRRAG